MFTEKGQGKSIISSNERFINVSGDRKEEVVTVPSSEKKSPTKDVD